MYLVSSLKFLRWSKPFTSFQRRCGYGSTYMEQNNVTVAFTGRSEEDDCNSGALYRIVDTLSVKDANHSHVSADVGVLTAGKVVGKLSVDKLNLTVESALMQGDSFSVELLNTALDATLKRKAPISSSHLERILHKITLSKCCVDQPSLRSVYMSLLGYSGDVTNKVAKQLNVIIEALRSTTDAKEQLEIINIYHVLFKRHPNLIAQFSQRSLCYFKYLLDVAQHVRFRVDHDCDSPTLVKMRQVLDELKVEYYSAISGHLYLPLVIAGTNMAIEVLTDMHLCHESQDPSPQTSIKRQLLNDMGWRIYYITQTKWDSIETEKKVFLSKYISYMYMDAQFIHKPKWVERFSM